jgi:hypothetical protein
MSQETQGQGEVAEALRHAAALLERDLSRTARDAREAAKDLAVALSRAAGNAAVEGAERTSRAIGAKMRRNPSVWLGAAFGAGVLVALLLSNRRPH